jgi:hypothetical protein
MRRNFTPDQELVDQLLSDDTNAFEELYHRYWYSLYSYSFSKLKSITDAKRIVRNVFVSLWNERNKLPVNFSLSTYLYSEVRSEVVKCVNIKIEAETENGFIENQILPGFNTTELYKARRPIAQNTIYPKPGRLRLSQTISDTTQKESWLEKQQGRAGFKGLKHVLQTMLNF